MKKYKKDKTKGAFAPVGSLWLFLSISPLFWLLLPLLFHFSPLCYLYYIGPTDLFYVTRLLVELITYYRLRPYWYNSFHYLDLNSNLL